jgi:hypothetical protein
MEGGIAYFNALTGSEIVWERAQPHYSLGFAGTAAVVSLLAANLPSV